MLRNNVKFSRRYLSAISDTNEEKTEAQNAADTMIYVKPQSSTIRLMLGISAVNLYVSAIKLASLRVISFLGLECSAFQLLHV